MYTVKTKTIRPSDLSKMQEEVDAATTSLSMDGCMIDVIVNYNDFETAIRYFEPVKSEYEFVVCALDRIDVKITLEKGETLYIKRNKQ